MSNFYSQSTKKNILGSYNYNCFIRFLITLIPLLLFSYNLKAQEIDTDVPIGWAAVPGNGIQSTTGGGNGNTVTATTASQLSGYAGSAQPLVIIVEGTLTGTGAINIVSNKTIIGKGTNAGLSGVGLNLSNVSNIIIRNLTITGSTDAIATRGSHHVWIDHCSVSNCGDGLIDITKQSDLHTVSWTRFSNHDKTMLINSGTSQPDDLNKLNTTLHHLWFDGTNQRNPRAGYGKIHVFNCFLNNNTSYGIGLHSQCRVLAESNYFNNVPNPISQMYRPDPNDIHHGFCESIKDSFVNCTGDKDDEGISFPVDHFYLYDFMLDETDNVPSLVQSNAGPGEKFEKLGLMPIPGNGAKNILTNATLSWTKGQSATSYIVHFGSDINMLADSTVIGQTFNPGILDSSKVYYWSVDQITATDTIQGKIWVFETLTGLPTITITSPASKSIIPALTKDITINANATDNNGAIAKVEFFRGITSMGVDSIPPYSYTWNNALAGEHMLSAKATDNKGYTVTSPLVYIKKENNPPSVEITSPSSDTTCNFPINILIRANASDYDGSIASVNFYNGSTLLSTDVSSPYSFTWNGIANGTYSITAVATDNMGSITTSNAINITLINTTSVLTKNYEQEVMLYPNSVDNNINISGNLNTNSKLKISIYNEIGRMVDSRDLGMFQQGNFKVSIPANNIISGVYILKVQMDSDVKTLRFIKK